MGTDGKMMIKRMTTANRKGLFHNAPIRTRSAEAAEQNENIFLADRHK